MKNWNLLESTVFRPQTPVFEEDAYTTVFEKVAALFESPAQNHSFHYANKRTALESMFFLLRYNKYHFKMPTGGGIEFAVDVVRHKYSSDEIAAIIKEHLMLHVD